MVIRTFFDKNNTIIYNSKSNTGKNPVTELFYGGVNNEKYFSRFIFKFDLDRIINLRNEGNFPNLSKFKHILKFTNTSTFDDSLLGEKNSSDSLRASSFNLNLYELNQEWDEGVGYDFPGQKYFTSTDNTTLSETPSNWFSGMTGNVWSEGDGTFDEWSGITITGTQHFSDGNENISLDVTDIINGYLSGDTNNGFGLAFDESLENTIDNELKSVGFFTRHTQTFYEPFLESYYDNTINDDRGNFYLNKLNKLYLYVNIGGKPTNVDDINTMSVVVNNESGDEFSAFTSSDITHEDLGIYSIELIVPSDNDDCVLYEDIWSGITINNVNIPPINLEFEIKNNENYFNIGSDVTKPREYKFNLVGIKDGEKINRGDIRKVRVISKVPFTVNHNVVLDSLEYRLYVKEGSGEYTVIDYKPINLAFNYNYFLLDTKSLVPQTYFLDIKANYSGEIRTIKDVISFRISDILDLRGG